MKKYRIFDKLFMSLGFISAGISSFVDYKEGESFIWQLSCMVWISVAYIKQMSIESMEDEK
jgi:hypothetical protein